MQIASHHEDLDSDHTTQGLTDDLLPKPVSTILYFRDGLQSLPQPSLSASDTYFSRSDGVGCLVEDAVTERRKAGEKIIMIIAATHTDADEHGITPHPETPWKVSQCQCHQHRESDSVQPHDSSHGRQWQFQPTSTTSVMPLDVPKGWSDEKKFQWEGSLAATRIQSFKRRLKAQLSEIPSTPPDLLEPHYEWLSLLPERAICLFSSVFFSDGVQVAFKRLLSRILRKRKVGASDVQAAFIEISESITTAEKKLEDPSLENSVGPKEMLSRSDKEGNHSNYERETSLLSNSV